MVPDSEQRGFTLIEALVALAVGLVTATVFVVIITEGLQQVRSTKRIERLHANAILLSNAFSYRIKQAERISVSGLPNPILTLTFPDSSTTTIAQVGDEIQIGGVSFTDIEIAVIDFTLREMTNSVRIGFTLESEGLDEKLSSTTTIARRNRP